MENVEPIEPLTVSVAKCRAMLGIGETKAFELIGSGELKSILIGRKRLVLVDSINHLVERRLTAEAAKDPRA